MKNSLYKLLRWSEKYAKTDMVYLVGQSSWLIIGQFFIFIFSFILAWLFANFVEPGVYGTYKFAITIATLASLTTLTGFGTAIARSFASKETVYLPGLMRIKFTAGLVGSLATFLIALYYVYQGNIELGILFIIVATFIPFFDSLGDFQFVLQGTQSFSKQTVYRIIQRLLVTLITAVAIIISGDLLVISFFYFSSLTIANIFLWQLVVSEHSSKTEQSSHKSITKYGYKLSAMNMFFTGAAHIDKLLLYHFLGPAQLAVYFFAVAMPGELNGALSNLSSVIFPRLVGKNSLHFKQALIIKILIYTLLLAVPVVFYILLAPWIFLVFFPVYIEAVPITQLFAGTLLFTPFSVMTHYFLATQNEKALAILTIITPSAQIVAMSILIPLYGLVGAVIAIYIKLTVDTLINLWFFLKN